MPLNPGGSEGTPDGAADNEGPHCRNCHIGASACNQCHGDKDAGGYGWYFSTFNNTGKLYTAVSSTDGSTKAMPGGSGNPYMTQGFVHTSAVANLNGQCVDGGFSWPHRTLGANLLKDELYGVNYDGTRVYTGDSRSVPTTWGAEGWSLTNYGTNPGGFDAIALSPYASDLYEGSNADVLINPTPTAHTPADAVGDVQNLDSVCIDCHGNATFWNGDDETTYKTTKTYQGGVVGDGWMLHLKGLP